MNSDFQVIINLHIARYKLLKENNNFEEAIKELEQIVILLSKDILKVFEKFITNLPKKEIPLLEGIKNITLEEVLNPDNIITINKDGLLRIKKT